ncbi:MAG: prefoldin subunit 5 [Gammaproteobacteria bacterium]|jgi:prefoldin subunit 5
MQELLINKVAQIEQKVRQLAAKLQTLQREHEKLKGDYKTLQSEVIQKNTKLLALEKQTKILPLAWKKDKVAELKDKKMKKEIAQYIKEIDKCIEWLQNS